MCCQEFPAPHSSPSLLPLCSPLETDALLGKAPGAKSSSGIDTPCPACAKTTQLTITASTPLLNINSGVLCSSVIPYDLPPPPKLGPPGAGLEVQRGLGLIWSWLPCSLPAPTCLTRCSTASPRKLAMMPRASMIDVSCSSRSNMTKIVLQSSWPCPTLVHRHAESGGICDHSSHKPPCLLQSLPHPPAGPQWEAFAQSPPTPVP